MFYVPLATNQDAQEARLTSVSPCSTAQFGESNSFSQLLIKDINKKRLQRLRLDKNGFPLALVGKHQDLPIPGRSRSKGMRMEELEFA